MATIKEYFSSPPQSPTGSDQSSNKSHHSTPPNPPQSLLGTQPPERPLGSIIAHSPFPDGVDVWYDCLLPTIDICFVHGLTGDRDTTWTHSDSPPWPKALLPAKLSRARILTYGYDAYVLQSSISSSNRLIDHAMNLLNDLTTERDNSGASSRPLIFAAHSLGGLVCKEAILHSRNNPEPHLQGIFLHLKGVLFMGTPHKGSWMADWADIPASALGILKYTNKSLLKILQTDDQRLEITCFYEELPLPVVGIVVPKESATLDSYNSISIHANHRDMVKFGSVEENGFKRLQGELLRWEKQIPADVLKRSDGQSLIDLGAIDPQDIEKPEISDKEALAQLIGFGYQVSDCIKEYLLAPHGVHDHHKRLAEHFAIVLATLDRLACKEWILLDQERAALDVCIVQAKELDSLLKEDTPEPTPVKADGERLEWLNRRNFSSKEFKKALKSVRGENKIRDLSAALDRLVSLVSLQLQTSTLIALEDRSRRQQQEQESSKVSKDGNEISTVPFTWNPAFIGRVEIFQQIDEQFFVPDHVQPIAAICGIGGIGKLQIALEYSFRVKVRPTPCSIFWVHAGSRARIEEAYDRIGSVCKIPGLEDRKGDWMETVCDWLVRSYKCAWLMIIDNIDDAGVLFDTTETGKSLIDYVPRSPYGSILYTTRNRDIACDLVGLPIDIPIMSFAEAQALLGKKLAGQHSEANQIELLDELEYIPLAIAQASAFMVKRRKSIPQYLEIYRKNLSTQTRLLSKTFADQSMQSRPTISVINTWVVSFNFIEKENPRSAELLALMSFLDRRGIPKSLLPHPGEDLLDFDDAVAMLITFSLIQFSDESFDMHRMVQMAMRAWLASYDKERGEEKAKDALNLLSKRFPYGMPHNWPTCANYLPHAEMVLNEASIDQTREVKLAKALLCYQVSSYLLRRGNNNVARIRSEESYQIRKNILGSNHPLTLQSQSGLAWVLQAQGKFTDAEVMTREVLRCRKEVLGNDHQDTLVTANDFGLLLQRLGFFDEALQICNWVVQSREKIYGREDRRTLHSLSNLAWVLQCHGKLDEAEPINREVIKSRTKVLGPENSETYLSLNDLGVLLLRRGQHEEAEKYTREALEGRARVLGEKNFETLISRSNLAFILQCRGAYAESETLTREVSKDWEEVNGSEHPFTLTSRLDLALVCQHQKKYGEAAEILEKVVEIRARILGREHAETIDIQRLLNNVLKFNNSQVS
ncbi:MAG: hypothetical protein M1829_005245 [Trizodia sp. TS-e1964]|nr:MAG: hypothetical protein M1829_005245 [Trizodia sp. TS-e1964]